jgi:hypothetical protein
LGIYRNIALFYLEYSWLHLEIDTVTDTDIDVDRDSDTDRDRDIDRKVTDRDTDLKRTLVWKRTQKWQNFAERAMLGPHA